MWLTGTFPGAPARAAMLARDVVLAALPPGVGPALAGGQPPFGTVALHGPAGALRLAAFRLPAAAPLSGTAPAETAAPFLLFDDAAQAGDAVPAQTVSLDIGALDAAALIAGLDAASRARLLDFLLAFCRTAFRLSDDAGFAGLLARLAALCDAAPGTAAPAAALLPGWQVLRGVATSSAEALYVIGGLGVRLARAAGAMPAGEAVAVAGARPGDLLLAVGASVRLWTVAAAEGALPHVLTLPADGFAASARAACRRALARAVPGSTAAALLRELQVLYPARPVAHDNPALPLGGALELAVPDGEGGMFLRGWLRDPLDLVADATLVTPDGQYAVPGAALHRVARPDLRDLLARAAHRDAQRRPGFVAHVPDPSRGGCLQPTLRLRLRSGVDVDLTPKLRVLAAGNARDVVLSSVLPSEANGALLRDCLAPAAAALHRRARAERGAAQVRRFGAPVARPRVSILVPLYRNLGFLRFQLAAFAADPECRAADLVYALDSPEQADEVAHLLAGLHHLHDLPLTLVVMERNAGFSAASNAAARHARGRLLLLLNSDVVPQRPGWLAALAEGRARAGAAAATAKLLFDDGSLQHAGLYFERDTDAVWFNRHYHKGLPRSWPGADTARHVPGGTGAALLVARERFEQVGGLCEDYVVGDYEDSDLCLRLQAAGGGIWYAPEAELYHFERRSIALHAGYQRTAACQFNRQLHHDRWDGAMAALMHEPRFRPAGRA